MKRTIQLDDILRTPIADWNLLMSKSRVVDHRDYYDWRDLKNSNIWGSDLSKRYLCGGVFSYSTIEYVSFKASDLRASNFSFCHLRNVDFSDSLLDGTDFSNASIIKCSFRSARIFGSDFTKTTFTDCNFWNSEISPSSLSTIEYFCAALTHARLKRRFERIYAQIRKGPASN